MLASVYFLAFFKLMFDYLQQFNSLPKDLKDKVSSPQAMTALSEIENHYQVDLAMIVMKVMIKGLAIKDLPLIFVDEFSLSVFQAEALTRDLKEKIFKAPADYLGLDLEVKELDLNKEINLLIKEAGLTIPSEFLIERLKKIIATYLKGVRSRVDTRESLVKDINIGGLGLSAEETDRILKVCDLQKFKNNENLRSFSVATPPGSRLDKIISAHGKTGEMPIAEYDFKRALASGEVKRISSPTEKLLAQAPMARQAAGDTLKRDNAMVIDGSMSVGAGVVVAPQAETASPITSQPTIQPTTQPIIQPTTQPTAQSATQPTTQPIIQPTTATPLKDRGIVHKPENISLFKKIFAEEQKKTSPGAIKFATTAPSPDVSSAAPSLASVAVASMSPASSIKDQGLSARPNTSVASARLAVNANQTPAPRNQAEFLARKKMMAMNRPRVEDVRAVPKVMGPIEELQFLDLTNFRRLGKNPEEITMKIFNKIKLLEKDGYDKMIAGIIAWKKSPVSLLYLKMVQEAVASGKTLKESLNLRQEKQPEALTMAEIEAIMSFNSRLVF